jgi:predicted O-methyltransferase YrrM
MCEAPKQQPPRSHRLRTDGNPHDLVAYPASAFARTHPDNLAAMAILHGLTPPPVEQCRVLEIACNEGSNLIPMAYAIPGGEFVGFDLARQPVERGQERIRELDLKNIRIFQGDVLEVGTELGQFDYVIAHGLYAWAPEAVRDRTLALCAELMAPNGIAFVSYNALPGGYLRLMIRDFLLGGVKGSDALDRQISDALNQMLMLMQTRAEGDAFRVEMEEEIERIAKRNPRLIFHDQLSPAYCPVYFSQFAGHAGRHGLQYVCEALIPIPNDPYYRFDLRTALEKAAPGDPITQEQMLDFARARQYRETLLCKAGLTVRRDLPPEQFGKLLLASHAEISPGEAPGALAFATPEGIRMETDHPQVCTLLGELVRAWPRAVPYQDLEPKLAAAGFTLDSDGATLLMRLAVSRMVELHAWNAPVAGALSGRPRASASARLEARRDANATTLLHSVVELEDPFARELLQLLDGNHDQRGLTRVLRKKFPDMPDEDLETKLESALRFFYRAGVLEA